MSLYSESYEASRANFIEKIRANGYQHTSVPIAGELTMDLGFKSGNSKKLLVITTGLHGIEGYLGSHMLDHFLSQLSNNFQSSILLVHGINPHGMKYFKRVNENNVDLNRNFVLFKQHHLIKNEKYELLYDFLNPSPKSKFLLNLEFVYKLLRTISLYAPSSLKESILKGQYEYPKGLYYGGQSYERSAAAIMSVLIQHFSQGFETIVSIDLHTGYGPRYDMSIVNSLHEPTDGKVLSKSFQYEHVLTLSKEEFYTIEGDFTDFQYDLKLRYSHIKSFYATCFEFGTLGNSLLNEISSLRTMIQENALRQGSKPMANIKAMRKLYLPEEEIWLKKAEADFSKALLGIKQHFEL